VPILHAIILGLTQGLSEFLPISSSGHLLLVPWLFGWHDFADKDVEKAFDVALHLGTLVAVVGYFWRDLVVYGRDGIRVVTSRGRRVTLEGRFAWLLLLATVPAGAIGAVFQDPIDNQLGRIPLIAVSLIAFGLLLWWADRLKGHRAAETFTVRDAVIVGAAQALALNPGTSRSGITITSARYQGFGRDGAARISFLMSIPVIAGAVVFKLAKLVVDGVPDGLGVPMVVGVITSGLSGWLAVWGLLRYVRTHSFTPFVVYRIVAGVLVLILAATVLN
jgi:undecaprenyl-diphosphatase